MIRMTDYALDLYRADAREAERRIERLRAAGERADVETAAPTVPRRGILGAVARRIARFAG
jgi:hypothetical protein